MNTTWIKRSDNRLLLLVHLLVVFNVLAFLTNNEKLLQMIEPLLFLPILVYFFYKFSNIGKVLLGFLLFVVLGDLANLFNMALVGIEIESIAYCLGYLCLIHEAIFRMKKFNISLLVGVYLLIVFAVNTYFLYSLYDILKYTVNDSIELSLIVARLVSLLLVALFSFTVYLSADSKQSILLLLMAICLVFSDVIHLVTEYYMYYWFFVFISKVLFLMTFYCFFLYAIDHKKSKAFKRGVNDLILN